MAWNISRLGSLGWEGLAVGRGEICMLASDPRAWVNLAAQKTPFLCWLERQHTACALL